MAYAPAANLTTTAGLTHLATVHYNRRALDTLRTNMKFWKLVDDHVIPLKVGKTMQWYRYANLGANTSTTTEGAVGTPIEMAPSSTVSVTVGQYSDFTSLSDMLVDTAIDGDIVSNASDQLGYRGALSFNRILRAEIDSVAASIDLAPIGDYASAADLAHIRTRFAGLDIKPRNNGYFQVLIHPYSVYDLKRDPSVGGWTDLAKQFSGAPNQGTLTKLEDRGFVGRLESCEIHETTDVTVVAGSPNKYRLYAAGMGAIAAVDLAGRGPTRTEDQDKTKFRVFVSRSEGPTVANPEGKIRAFASYNVVFAAKLLDSNPYRLRKIDHANSLGI